MKTIAFALIAAALVGGSFSAQASEDAGDSLSQEAALIQLWISTGDATYARLAGLTDSQIAKAARLPVETRALGE